MPLSRRTLLGTAAAAAALSRMAKAQKPSSLPVAISSANGVKAVERAVELMQKGNDPLEAAIAGVNIVEDDPEDMTVGYGGIPNEEGVVQLDACVFHGPTAPAGAVAPLESVKKPPQVAELAVGTTH